MPAPSLVEAVAIALAESAFLGGRAHHMLFSLFGADDSAPEPATEGIALVGVALGLFCFARRRAALLVRGLGFDDRDSRARWEGVAMLAIVVVSVPMAGLVFALTDGVQISAIATGLGAIASGAMLWSALGSAAVSRHTAWATAHGWLVIFATALSALPGVPMFLAAVVALLWIGHSTRKSVELGALIAGAHALSRGLSLWFEDDVGFDFSTVGILVASTLVSLIGIALVTRRLDLVFRFAPLYLVGLGGALVLGGFILGSFA